MSAISSHGTSDVPEPVARLVERHGRLRRALVPVRRLGPRRLARRQTREHHDVDIVMFEADLPALARHLEGWQLVAHDELDPDSTQPWTGRRLRLPAHVHSRLDGYEIDVQVGRRSGDRWQLSRTPRLTRSMPASCIDDVAGACRLWSRRSSSTTRPSTCVTRTTPTSQPRFLSSLSSRLAGCPALSPARIPNTRLPRLTDAGGG